MKQNIKSINKSLLSSGEGGTNVVSDGRGDRKQQTSVTDSRQCHLLLKGGKSRVSIHLPLVKGGGRRSLTEGLSNANSTKTSDLPTANLPSFGKEGFRINFLKTKLATVLTMTASLAALAILTLAPQASQVVSALSITSITTNQGPLAGGNQITISGSGFMKTTEQKDRIVKVVGTGGYDGAPYMALSDNSEVYAIKSSTECYVIPESLDEYIFDITNEFKLSDDEQVTDIAGNLALTNKGRLFTVVSSDTTWTSAKITDVTSQLNESGAKKIINIHDLNLSYALTNDGQLFEEGYDASGNIVFANITSELNLSSGDRLDNIYSDGYDVTLTTARGRQYATYYYDLYLTDITADLDLAKDETIVQVNDGLVITNKGRVFDLQRSYKEGDDGSYHYVYTVAEATSELYAAGLPKDEQIDGVYYYETGRGDADDTHYAYITTTNGKTYQLGDNFPTDVTAELGGKITGLDNVYQYSIMHLSNGTTHAISQWEGNSCQIYAFGYLDKMTDVTNKFPLESKTITEPNISKLYIGGKLATVFTVLDDNTITATVPAGTTPGKVDVEITTKDNQTTNLPKSYEYLGNKDDNNNNEGDNKPNSNQEQSDNSVNSNTVKAPNTGV